MEPVDWCTNTNLELIAPISRWQLQIGNDLGKRSLKYRHGCIDDPECLEHIIVSRVYFQRNASNVVTLCNWLTLKDVLTVDLFVIVVGVVRSHDVMSTSVG